MADQSAAPLQRRYLALAVSERFEGFADVEYPDWQALLRRLSRDAELRQWRGPLVLDEFPYMVSSDASLPSVLQNWLDHEARRGGLVVAIAGSSERMMHGLVLDAGAPLFGRAHELIHLKPLAAGLIHVALHLSDSVDAVRAYAVWGGIPWYWELAERYTERLDEAVDALVLDPRGPLHSEPDRLLLEEIPPAITLRPLLDAIGAGANRLSEIAGRVGQPAGALSRPISRLVDLGIVRREVPFGISARSSKRSMYAIDDPFMRLWFRVVAPYKSLYAKAPRNARLAMWERYRRGLVGACWEDLCRECVSYLSQTLGTEQWMPAGRYWHGDEPELDVVSRSLDGSGLLLGEAKWISTPADRRAVDAVYGELLSKGIPRVGQPAGVRVIHAVFVPEADITEDSRRGLGERVTAESQIRPHRKMTRGIHQPTP